MSTADRYRERADVLADPATSYWLAHQLGRVWKTVTNVTPGPAVERDICDALDDAEMLVAILTAEYDEIAESMTDRDAS